jgi:hypothetical protein
VERLDPAAGVWAWFMIWADPFKANQPEVARELFADPHALSPGDPLPRRGVYVVDTPNRSNTRVNLVAFMRVVVARALLLSARRSTLSALATH